MNEILELKKALIEGKINGSAYQGECACLIGTIANIKKCHFEQMPILKPHCNRPAERFFLGIKTGDTPDNNQISKIVVEWIDEFTNYIDSHLFSYETETQIVEIEGKKYNVKIINPV